jgi:bifunctional DNase/RNase
VHKLGGKLQSIIVHECEPGERYFVLHCALSIDHEGRRFQIPLKASDAFAVALETTSPILVSQRVLKKAPHYRPGMDGGLHNP